MTSILIISVLVSFLLAIITIPKWIKVCRKVGLLWEDMNKFNHPKNVASSGGLVVVASFVGGVLVFVALRTFLGIDDGINVQIFALLSIILILALVGLTDDLLGWKHGGLSKKSRIFLAFLATIPLVVINAGTHFMNLPFLGSVDFGLFFPLLIIPLGVAGSAITYNFLAGFNGLEAGQGILILSFLSYVSYVTGSPWLAIIGLCMVATLLVFLFFNKSPAKVFPGDALTYSVGALIAIMAILGNFEKVALIVMIPYIIEFILKTRGGLGKHSFGTPEKDGSLSLPYKKIYGLTHFSIWFLSKIKKKVYERDVTYFIHIIQILFILLAFLML
jgi:UDP-N-acetylglucosamine--dolichyl-phosphate N-acetylglucosaminephosphotransferase